MARRCSICSSCGHSKRTCSRRRAAAAAEGGVRLFGVRLTDGSLVKKSASMGSLEHYTASASAAGSPEGYHSDDPAHGSAARQRSRKKGIPWTEQEHMQFLVGLQKLGKGDWRGISKNYVPSKTPTQVASHAQKYFIRQTTVARRKRRTSVFDMVPDMEGSPRASEKCSAPLQKSSTANKIAIFSSVQEADFKSSALSLDLSLKPAFMPMPFQILPASSKDDKAGTSRYQIHKPNSVVPEESIKELVGMSQLTLGETDSVSFMPPQLSLRQPGDP